MELTQIRYFVAVAQCENMSRAAAQLHISQPSLSKAIAKMESELGCKLFARNGRHISLNDEGRRFLKGALAIIRELDDTSFDLREMTQSPVARLTIGIADDDERMTGCLMEFSRLHPEVRFHLQCNIEALENVDINQFDMLLYPQGEHFKKFSGTAIGKARYYLAASRDHAIVRRFAAHLNHDKTTQSIDIASLEQEEFVFIRHGRDYTELPYEMCVGGGMHPRVRVFTNSRSMHRQIIALGDAIGFVAEGCTTPYKDDARVCLLPLANEDFCATTMVCFKREKHLSATGKLLQEHVMAQFVEKSSGKVAKVAGSAGDAKGALLGSNLETLGFSNE